MDQVIDEPDECVLSTDQLTLMRLWLLQAKYFPLLIFSHACLSPLSLLIPPSLPHIFRLEKSCCNSCGTFLGMYTAERRNIYTMGYGDDLAQCVSLWRAMTFPFSPRGRTEQSELFRSTKADMHRCVYIHKTCINTANAIIVVATQGRRVPASQQHPGPMGGLRSLLPSLSLSASPPPAVLLLRLIRVEVSEGRGGGKSLPALCVGNPDKSKHNMTHCSLVVCEFRVCLREENECKLGPFSHT